MTIERALEALRRAPYYDGENALERLKEDVNDAIKELTKPCETCGGECSCTAPVPQPCGRNCKYPYTDGGYICPNNCVGGVVPIGESG